ncbi:hypothetical protein OEZ85_005361 [Tetradesmus obliquus]|uniref:Protein kinase domain-containing protein n=1 Tax=Tetradesmus obliquus TaxID=3088 RepID=A0ABY8UN45_TETOB|nr:hypothetical protein OEZ85_005361 [Tetradesmus obliquus]
MLLLRYTSPVRQGEVVGGRYMLQHLLGTGPRAMAEGLGVGRFSTLWAAKDLASGQQVVVKVVDAADAADAVSYTAGTREAALHAMAGRHPNIVPLLDAFEHRSAAGRHACMVLQREGSALDYVFAMWALESRLLRRTHNVQASRSLLPEGLPLLRSICRQLLQALHHLHSRGIVHMDLSLDNIIMDKPHAVVLGAKRRVGLGDYLKVGWVLAKAMHEVLLQKLRPAKSKPFKAGKEGDAAEHGTEEILQEEYNIFMLRTATFRLADFGRAVLVKPLAAQQGSLLEAAPPIHDPRKLSGPEAGTALMRLKRVVSAQGSKILLQPAPYELDGALAATDPCLRPPEEILGLPYATPAYDIWRLGCLLAELAMGYRMWDEKDLAGRREDYPRTKPYSDDALLLMEMQAWLGSPPRAFTRSSPRFRELYLPNDLLHLCAVYELKGSTLSIAAQVEKKNILRSITPDMTPVLQLQSMVMSMLAYDPAQRPSAGELLQHEFLQEE